MKSAPVITFEYRPSRWIALSVASVAALALIALVGCGLPTWIKFALGAFVGSYAVMSIWRYWRMPTMTLTWLAAGHWRISGMTDTETSAEIEHAVIRAGWIALSLRCANRKTLRLLLTPDVCDAQTRRVLCVRLARSQTDQALDG